MSARPGFRRDVTVDEIDTFWTDGVVCLRGILDSDLVMAMAGPVDAILDAPEMADLSAMGDGLAAGGETVLTTTIDGSGGAPARGRFVSGIDHWLLHEPFRAFACDSALAEAVGALLRTTEVHLWEDSVLVKEPGAREHTAWHQDLSYFPLTGDQLATTWAPLDTVSAATGAMRFVQGSHRWSELYKPNLFVSTMTIPGTTGDEMPDVDALAATGEIDLISFDTEPGDCTVHHARTLHAAGANTSATTRRRAISVRYLGDDVRFAERSGVVRKPHHPRRRYGDRLGPPECPLVWTSQPA